MNRPSFPRLLLLHVLCSVLTHAVWMGVHPLMAILARKRFGASDWQTVLVTAAGPALLMLSVFWGDLLQRVPIRRYLVWQWALTMIPLACAALAQEFWHVLLCQILACIGSAGWSPAAGELLKGFYDDRIRGRVFSIIQSAVLVGMTVTSFAVGRGFDVFENGFRFLLPAAAVTFGIGMLLLRRLVRSMGIDEQRTLLDPASAPIGIRRYIEPVAHIRTVLRQDRTFYRYEAAFMTYGVGWMICNALLPVLATDRLKMTYTQYAGSTQVVYPLGMLLMIFPMGWIMDRIGPGCASGLSFAGLSLYPLGLMWAWDTTSVGAASLLYGLAMAGVQIGWTLGPVTLAPSPEKVGQYSAIHATLVGFRAIVAQGLGMLLYSLTGNFTWPFAVASFAFAWACLQMWRLPEPKNPRTQTARPKP